MGIDQPQDASTTRRRGSVFEAYPDPAHTTKRADPALVSVVLPTLNGADTVEQQLEALSRQTYEGEWELVVADTSSTDGTPEIAERWSDRLPGLRVVNVPDRLGVSHSSNVGARAAKGDFVAFCHQDDIADEGWLESLVALASEAEAVGGYMSYEELSDPSVALWPGPFPDDRLPITMGFLPYAVGANLGIWADVLAGLGGWNEDLKGGGEDVDLCWRLQLEGYRLAYAPSAVMHFRFRSDPGEVWRQFRSYGSAEPALFSRYESVGVRRSSVLAAAKGWAWLIVHLPDLVRGGAPRTRWMRKAAFHWGRIVGSWRHRVVYV